MTINFNYKTRITHLIYLLFSITLFISNPVFGQKNFNQFETLLAKGAIPIDFSSTTQEKIEKDINENTRDLSKKKQAIFVKGIHERIDLILHSGNVVYGDEVSTYVEKVAEILLKNEPELKAKLRFYTLKSNETNAFSTDQGIVFVTTGLIAQLASEAQLAYVLSHEIAHYTEKHVVETFDWKTTRSNRYNSIEKLSSYSKENELEADRVAIKMYHAAGYSQEDLISTFDVLMYSYLPFDEIPVPFDYFNTSKLYVPQSIFNSKTFPITAIEDYDDEKSSHPNIKKRKEAVEEQKGKFANWGNKNFLLNKTEFVEIRNIARFESIRTAIIDNDFYGALYTIFILQRDFPQSSYLKQMKALAWLSIAQFTEANRISEIAYESDELEGESARLFATLAKLSNKARFTIALRYIYDLKKEEPNNKFIGECYNRLLRVLAKEKSFKLEEYSKNTFQEAIALKNKPAEKVEKKEEEINSKYKRIKSKKEHDASGEIDSLDYYFYGIPDIVADTIFTDKLTNFISDLREKETDENLVLTKKERKILEEQEKNKARKVTDLAIDKFVLIEPVLFNNGKRILNQKTINDYTHLIEDIADKQLITCQSINLESIKENGTSEFNKRSTLISLIEQKGNLEEIEMMPIDFNYLQTMKEELNTENVMFSVISYDKNFDENIFALVIYNMVLPVFIPVTLLVYLPHKIVTSNVVTCYSIMLNMNTGELMNAGYQELNGKLRKPVVGSYFHNLFANLKK
jgi:predicted Zn-dependent protease